MCVEGSSRRLLVFSQTINTNWTKTAKTKTALVDLTGREEQRSRLWSSRRSLVPTSSTG